MNQRWELDRNNVLWYLEITRVSNNTIEIPEQNTVDSRYLEIEGTLKNTSKYPHFDISDL